MICNSSMLIWDINQNETLEIVYYYWAKLTYSSLSAHFSKKRSYIYQHCSTSYTLSQISTKWDNLNIFTEELSTVLCNCTYNLANYWNHHWMKTEVTATVRCNGSHWESQHPGAGAEGQPQVGGQPGLHSGF